MNTAALPNSSSDNHYIPRLNSQIASFRALSAAQRELVTVEQADLIGRQWAHQRTIAGRPGATKTTHRRYLDDARQKARQYFPLGSTARMTPTSLVDAFFNDAKNLAPASFKRYRSAVLYTADLSARKLTNPEAVAEWKIARARLILQIEPPFVDERSPTGKPPKRVKTISSKDSSTLIAWLKTGRGNAKKVAAFAEATLATGARPGEWAEVQLLTEGVSGVDADHFVLVFRTSKRKGGAIEHRALRIDRSLLGVIEAHIRYFRAAQQKNSSARKTDAVAVYIKRCSTRLASGCKRLWPGDATRRITLSSLRSQARADFSTLFGKAEVAGMMGHAIATGDGFYAPKRKGSLGILLRTSPCLNAPTSTVINNSVPSPAASECLVLSPALPLSVDSQDANVDDASQDEGCAPRP